MNNCYRQLRTESFATDVPIDQALVGLLKDLPDHRFLTNPAAQNIYQYLALYVRMLSEKYFGRRASEIKVLDWGCGKGHFSYLLRQNGFDPTSCDVYCDGEDSSFGQKTPILDYFDISVDPLHDEVVLPYDAASQDVVISCGVLEHVSDDVASMKEINRILRSGGLFFCFFLPYDFSWTQRLAHLRGDYYHERLYSWSDVDRLVCSAGWRVLDRWHRQLLPKNNVYYPCYQTVENADLWLTERTFLKYLATNIEFVAMKE